MEAKILFDASATVIPRRDYTKSLTSATDLVGISVALSFSICAVIALLGDLPASILPLVTSDLVFSGGLGTLLKSAWVSSII